VGVNLEEVSQKIAKNRFDGNSINVTQFGHFIAL
jgi:hypothetical protein